MKLFILDNLPWRQSQLIYHALAYLNIEGLVLHSTKERYMCVGLHQDPRDEINIDYCQKNNIGIFRREIGGGVVLLDNNQIFYHLIFRRNNPKVPYAPESFFRRFLQPVIKTYKELGITTEYRPLCDLVVNNKKISGNGGGEVGECKILGGGILLDFDTKLMANAVQSSDEMKTLFHNIMKNNITTVQQELGQFPSKDEIYSILTKKFEELLGPMTIGKLDNKIINKMDELNKLYSSEKWLYQRGVKQIGREIKVREGVFLFQKEFNLSNECIKIIFEIKENKINNISFPGPFPLKDVNPNKIKEDLVGLDYDKKKVESTIINIIKNQGESIYA
jgi:lipoate-protein ligase A